MSHACLSLKHHGGRFSEQNFCDNVISHQCPPEVYVGISMLLHIILHLGHDLLHFGPQRSLVLANVRVAECVPPFASSCCMVCGIYDCDEIWWPTNPSPLALVELELFQEDLSNVLCVSKVDIRRSCSD